MGCSSSKAGPTAQQPTSIPAPPSERVQIEAPASALSTSTPSDPSQVPAALRASYTAGGQAHVFKFIDEGKITSSEASALIAQLSDIDVPLVNELFAATMAAASSAAEPVSAQLSPAEGVASVTASEPAVLEGWRREGLAAIAAGRVGVLILAGGQGTRLGFDRPKGLYDVRLPSHKSLFELQAQRLRRLAALAGEAAGLPAAAVSLPLYIMTSPMTDADTRAYWEERGFFGLPRGDVRFFCQGTLPCLDFEGRMLLERGGLVAAAPDGNGGIYRALHLSGCIADMGARGLAGVHVWAVDNAAVVAGDPAFLGLCLARGADVGSKVCAKSGPHERVGVLCRRGGAYTVVEYSEMDAATAELRGPSGELLYNAGNICMHFYALPFLRDTCAPAALPKVYHLAKKAIPYAHPASGVTLSKEELRAACAGRGGLSGVKLESFIFDVFPASRAMAALEVPRAAEFAPVKNAPGEAEDSPDTARAALSRLHAGWLQAAGAALAGAHPVEVSPLVSYGGEGLAGLAGAQLQTPALLLAAGEPLPPGAQPAGEPQAWPPGASHAQVSGVDMPEAPGATLHVYRMA